MFDRGSFELAEQQVPQIASLVRHEVNSVLDLACGPGRHCLALAKMGYEVTGIDISEFLLKKAKQKSYELELKVKFKQSDILEYENKNQFDLIVNMFNSFGYLDTQEKNQKVLNLCFENLKNQGTLIIDTIGKEPLARNLHPVHLAEFEDGSLKIERPYLSDDLQMFNNEWILIQKDDQVFRRKYQHFIYTATELKLMCQNAGFQSVEVFGSLLGEAYELDSEQLVVVAEKF